MRTALSTINAAVAESPVALIADVAAPETLICPCFTPSAKGSRLQSLHRIFCRQSSATFCTARNHGRRDIALRIQHVWWLGIRSKLSQLAHLGELAECCVAEAEPVEAAKAATVAGEAEVVGAVEADGAGIV